MLRGDRYADAILNLTVLLRFLVGLPGGPPQT
jgi:hypothetical protein